jgi:hypothetical protein
MKIIYLLFISHFFHIGAQVQRPINIGNIGKYVGNQVQGPKGTDIRDKIYGGNQISKPSGVNGKESVNGQVEGPSEKGGVNRDFYGPSEQQYSDNEIIQTSDTKPSNKVQNLKKEDDKMSPMTTIAVGSVSFLGGMTGYNGLANQSNQNIMKSDNLNISVLKDPNEDEIKESLIFQEVKISNNREEIQKIYKNIRYILKKQSFEDLKFGIINEKKENEWYVSIEKSNTISIFNIKGENFFSFNKDYLTQIELKSIIDENLKRENIDLNEDSLTEIQLKFIIDNKINIGYIKYFLIKIIQIQKIHENIYNSLKQKLLYNSRFSVKNEKKEIEWLVNIVDPDYTSIYKYNNNGRVYVKNKKEEIALNLNKKVLTYDELIEIIENKFKISHIEGHIKDCLKQIETLKNQYSKLQRLIKILPDWKISFNNYDGFDIFSVDLEQNKKITINYLDNYSSLRMKETKDRRYIKIMTIDNHNNISIENDVIKDILRQNRSKNYRIYKIDGLEEMTVLKLIKPIQEYNWTILSNILKQKRDTSILKLDEIYIVDAMILIFNYIIELFETSKEAQDYIKKYEIMEEKKKIMEKINTLAIDLFELQGFKGKFKIEENDVDISIYDKSSIIKYDVFKISIDFNNIYNSYLKKDKKSKLKDDKNIIGLTSQLDDKDVNLRLSDCKNPLLSMIEQLMKKIQDIGQSMQKRSAIQQKDQKKLTQEIINKRIKKLNSRIKKQTDGSGIRSVFSRRNRKNESSSNLHEYLSKEMNGDIIYKIMNKGFKAIYQIKILFKANAVFLEITKNKEIIFDFNNEENYNYKKVHTYIENIINVVIKANSETKSTETVYLYNITDLMKTDLMNNDMNQCDHIYKFIQYLYKFIKYDFSDSFKKKNIFS